MSLAEIVVIPPERWFFSLHGLQRMQEMNLSRNDVLDVLEDADVVYASQGRTVATKGDLAVVFQEDRIVTILYHRQEQWQR